MIEITGVAVLAGWAIYFWRKTAEYDRVIVQLANQQNDIVRILIIAGIAAQHNYEGLSILVPDKRRDVDSVPHKE